MSARRSSSTSAVLLAILIAAARLTAAQKAPEAAPEIGSLPRGETLFTGTAPLQGKPRGHHDLLPPEVVRCANCHSLANQGTKLKLDPASLLEQRQRRNGPPSAYNQAKFCKLLRTGVDPAYIMIDHAMPIYDIPDADCVALWSYITRKEAPRETH